MFLSMKNTVIKTIVFACLFTLTLNADVHAQAAPEVRNKAWVLAALDAIMVRRDPAEVEHFFAEPFIEHAPGVDNGLTSLKALVTALAQNPTFSYKPVRAIAEGDWVAVHGRYVGWAPQPAIAIDLFRVQKGKIVEHWDGLGVEAGPTPSGHTMLDGPTDVDANNADTLANRALVEDFITTVLIRSDAARLPEYFNDGAYIQHNPHIADGIGGLQDYMAGLAAAGTHLRYTQIRRTMAEGNFVLVESTGEFDGHAHVFFDIFRVESGYLAEHWDVSAAWDPDTQ